MPATNLLNTLALGSFSVASTQPSLAIQHPLLSTGFPPIRNEGESSKASDAIVVAPGLPPLKRSLVDNILAGKFVELGELPPAKGLSKPLSAMASGLEGQIVLLHAAELAQAKKIIPDLAIWSQCFAIYAAVVLTSQPARAPSMLMYMATIAKLSKKFHWPTCIIYDHNFREEAAATGTLDWSKIDAGTYAICFTNQALRSEGWCLTCKSMEHSKDSCPLRPTSTPSYPTKRRSTPTAPPAKRQRPAGSVPHPCRDWNKHESYMDCSYGESCRFLHICGNCRQPDHAAPKCATNSKKKL